MSNYLSYLMGADQINSKELTDLGIEIIETTEDRSRKLVVPENSLALYLDLIKAKLTNGFWNEVIGKDRIIFLFKLADGTTKQYVLSPENEQEVDNLCAKLNNEPPDKTANVYKYISNNDFYHNFMLEHYADMIDRK